MTQVADKQGLERDEAEDVPKPLIRFEDFATCILPELEQYFSELEQRGARLSEGGS